MALCLKKYSIVGQLAMTLKPRVYTANGWRIRMKIKKKIKSFPEKMISLFKRDPVITPFIYQTRVPCVCVCVIFAIHPRDIPRQRSLSRNWMNNCYILYLCRCFIMYCWLAGPGYICTVGLWKKRKITGSFVHVWPVYVFKDGLWLL